MPAFRFRDRAVVLPAADALVCSDLHLGRGEASDVEYPVGDATDLAARLRKLLSADSPTEVVFAGDLLHEFRRASLRTSRSLSKLADVCREAGATPVLVAGNHDAMLPEVWNGPVRDAYALEADGERVVVRHGHETPPRDDDADCYVVGHDHPTIAIEGHRRPCFLFGPDHYRGADVLMLPSFTRLAAGVEVNGMGTRDFDSPFVTDADGLRPVVRDADAGETLSFPPLGAFRRML